MGRFASLLCATALAHCGYGAVVKTDSHVFVGTQDLKGSIERYTMASTTSYPKTADFISTGGPGYLVVDNKTDTLYVLNTFGPNTWGRLSYYGLSGYADMYLGGFLSTQGTTPQHSQVCVAWY